MASKHHHQSTHRGLWFGRTIPQLECGKCGHGIRGVKVAYPSTGADLKGLMKAAFYDPNPVVMLEHKGLYWSKIKGTEGAKTPEPSADYVVPFGKARMVLEADADQTRERGEAAW
jgi:2-oxoisovalerate dehydrogenase E1 component